MELNKVYLGDAAEVLRDFPDESIDCVVTSPPYYGLRDYGVDGQLGLEDTPDAFVENLVAVFREVRRVLKKDGTVWVNLGDTYNGAKQGNTEVVKHKKVAESNEFQKKLWSGAKPKDLIGIPWMFAFAMRADGWYLRQDIIWAKPNPMPESVTDRCTKSHEYIFLFSKSEKYWFDYKEIQEPAVTFEERPGGVVRERELGYNSKRNLNPEAYLVKAPKFGGKKYGENDDKHYSTYSGKGWVPQTRSQTQGYALAGGHRDNSGGFSGDVVVRNKRDVWTVNVKPTKEAHFATYPQKLITPCILAGCRRGGGSP